MRKHLFFWGAAILCLACGGSNGNPLQDAGGGTDGTMGDDTGDMTDTGVDTGADTFTCDNLECQIVKCEAGSTSVSGVVTTPNGQYPIYNAQVYVPNAATTAIADGVSCTACQAPLSGKPLISGQLAIATTDAKGAFTLKDVPVGANIPLVVQLGKWRREVTIPNVTACSDNPLAKDLVRLPKNQSEGHMPLIAMQTGCDQTECTVLQRMGIADTEFTGPTGNGRIHMYRGIDANQGLPANPGNAYTLWGNLQSMKKYDLLVNACECSLYARDSMGTAYDNLKSYLEAGGRFIGNHYHYNWFANSTQCNNPTCKGPADFNTVADWGQSQPNNQPINVETAHPRGTAFATWLMTTNASTTLGQLTMTNGDLRNDVRAITSPTTRWLSLMGNGPQTVYLTFNTPTTGMNQCGRAGFADFHLRTGGGGGTWPSTICQVMPQTPQGELAFTFFFFDSFSCVQDDTKAPISPPTQ